MDTIILFPDFNQNKKLFIIYRSFQLKELQEQNLG